jgi:hypothetical protein
MSPDLFGGEAPARAGARAQILHSDTDLYRAVSDLSKFIARAVLHLRRDLKPTYGKLLVEESVWMGVVVRRANIARDQGKLRHFDELLEQLEIIQFTLRTLCELKFLPHSTFAQSLPITGSVGRQATALRKTFDAPAP